MVMKNIIQFWRNFRILYCYLSSVGLRLGTRSFRPIKMSVWTISPTTNKHIYTIAFLLTSRSSRIHVLFFSSENDILACLVIVKRKKISTWHLPNTSQYDLHFLYTSWLRSISVSVMLYDTQFCHFNWDWNTLLQCLCTWRSHLFSSSLISPGRRLSFNTETFAL